MNTLASETSGTSRGIALGKVIGVSIGVGLAAFIGLRIKTTLAERAALTASQAEQVKAGPKRSIATTVHATPRTWRPRIPVTGTLSPQQDSDVGFKTGGRLQTVNVKIGDRIKVGHPLASLDVAEASAQAVAASALVRAAQITYDMAKDAEARTGPLFEQKAVSDAEYTAVKNKTALAFAQLEQARAQARLASVGVSNGLLLAPFSGLVTRAPNGVGKIVAPGEPLFHLEDTGVLKLTATLTEADARLVQVGADVSIDELGVGGDAPDAKKPGQAQTKADLPTGKVTAVLGSLDAQTRRVPITAEIQNDIPSPMLAGSFVRATITSAREVSVLALPAASLKPGSQDEVVVATNGKAKLSHVTFVLEPDGSLLVRSGLSVSDAVVQNPSAEVRDGDELNTSL